MKTAIKISVLGIGLLALLFLDVVPLELLVPDAEAVAGVRRRTARRTAVVVGSAGAASTAAAQQQTAAANQAAADAQADAAAAEAEAAAAQQQAAAAQQQAAAAQQPAPAPAPAALPPGALPLNTIVTELPPNCPSTVVNGVEYHACGGNYYRAAFSGSQLVYVTTQP